MKFSRLVELDKGWNESHSETNPLRMRSISGAVVENM